MVKDPCITVPALKQMGKSTATITILDVNYLMANYYNFFQLFWLSIPPFFRGISLAWLHTLPLP